MGYLPSRVKKSWSNLLFISEFILIFSVFSASTTNVFAAGYTDTLPSSWLTIKGQAQGTTYAIKYLPGTDVIGKSQIDSVLSSIDLSLSLYRNDSRISQFNQTVSEFPADQHIATVLETALRLQHLTNGAFDVRIYNLSQAWGFGPKPDKRPPSKLKIKRLKPQITDSVWLEGQLMRKNSQLLRIDLDGIAQGYSVDVLAEFLHNRRVRHFLVELGGEIRTSGDRPDGKPWIIGIESPMNNENVESLMVSPGQGAITTSGSYRKTRRFGKRIFSHVINPKTGRPIENGMLSCTVIAPSAMLADALDNVGMVLGPTAAIEVFSNFSSVEAFFVWRDKDGSIHTKGTPGFYKKLMLEHL